MILLFAEPAEMAGIAEELRQREIRLAWRNPQAHRAGEVEKCALVVVADRHRGRNPQVVADYPTALILAEVDDPIAALGERLGWPKAEPEPEPAPKPTRNRRK